MNRYYLCDLGATVNVRNQRVAELRQGLPNGPTRQEAKDQLHYALSFDGRWAMANLNTSDADHTWLTGLGYVTYQGEMREGGLAPQATYDYLAANSSLWNVAR